MLYKFTGDTAIKKAQELNKELEVLYNMERNSCSTSYIDGEDKLFSNYNFKETEEKFYKLSKAIVTLKSALKDFNSSRKGQLTGFTIDEILIYMPIMKNRQATLNSMRQKQFTTRITRNNVSEFTELNYSLLDVEEEYKKITGTLVNLQSDLNYLNITGTFEVELDI